MTLTLHYHPLSSFCQKVVIGFYELGVDAAKETVNLYDPIERARFLELWPIGKFPVLRDETRGVTVPESTLILDYVDPGGRLLPADPDRRRECRVRDRVFDLYVNVPLGKIVTDKLRPPGAGDPHGVEEARAMIRKSYQLADEWLREGPWAAGEAFSLADCAAAPALFFAKRVEPFGPALRRLDAYFTRLEAHPSVSRTFAQAAPHLVHFPG